MSVRLVVEFDEDMRDGLKEWKLNLLGREGKGAIKQRIQELVAIDLKLMRSTH